MNPHLLLGVVLTSLPLAAQNAWRFDMGQARSPVASGFTRVTETTSYAPTQGYGWTLAPQAAYDRTATSPNIQTTLDPTLIRDGNGSRSDMTFRLDVPNGTYHVEAYLGDLGTLLLPTPHENLDVIAEGVQTVFDVNARTLTQKAVVTSALGGAKRATFVIDVQDGSLDVTFHADGTGTSTNAVLGLVVREHREAPLRYDHTANRIVAAPAFAGAASAFLNALNAGDDAQAEVELGSLADPLLKAWATAWLTGFLTGSESDGNTDWIDAAQALLAPLNRDDPRVATLWQDLADFERGLLYNRLRGYSQNVFPESLGGILLNLNAAVALFEQMDSDLLEPVSSPHAYGSPLFPRAQFLIARNLYSRNTKIGDPAKPYNVYWFSIFQKFAARLTLFPRAANLRVFTWFVQNYAITGGVVGNWPGANDLPNLDPTTAWWSPLAEVTPDPAAPNWANLQRQYVRAYRNAGTWWMETRLHGGELGGGGGDDVEGAGLLALPTIVRRETGNALETGTAVCLDQVLQGPEVNQDQAYFANCGDVEHAAEYTTNPLFILLPTQFGNPEYLEFALRLLRNMDDQEDTAPWSLPINATQRRFRAHRFGANAICGPTRDIPLNVRAVIPGFTVGDYNDLPRLRQLFDEWARAWRDAAMSNALGKPIGIFPSAVEHATGVFGTGGSWWKNGGYYDLQAGAAANYHASVYTLLLSAYQNSTATDRHVLLQPILAATNLVDDFLRGLLTNTQEGGDAWTADVLKNTIAKCAFHAKPFLLADPVLALTPQDAARIDRVIDAYAPSYLKFRNQTGPGPKDKSSIEATFADAVAWMRYLWVLGTSSVTYTDRIYVMTKGSHGLQYSCTSGGDFDITPTFPITWSNPDPQNGELDLAILVTDVDTTSLKVLLHSFENTPRDVDLTIWRQLEFGSYTLRIGTDANHDDVMDGAPHTVIPFTFDHKGKTVRIPQLPVGALQVLELHQVTPLPGSANLLPDPAISAADLVDLGQGVVQVTVHNLGSAGLGGGTRLDVYDRDVLVGSHVLGRIQAPFDFTPRPLTLQVPFNPVYPNSLLRVVLTPPAGVEQITTLNDEASVPFQASAPAIAIENHTAFGTFDVVLDSPIDPLDGYWIGVSWTGTSPGIPLSPAITLPITLDVVTLWSLDPAYGLFSGSLGLLDAQGRGTLHATIPMHPLTIGTTFYFAGVTFDAHIIPRATSGAIRITL
ncbi:MAG: hypothetical protein H6834_12515 [Planctomycetes bacterium]|nr:hypothetical protein [Planctomycetota bacterium]